METQTLTRAPQLAARLLELDSAIAGLQTERFHVLAEMRALDQADGQSERQTAVTVAQLSRFQPTGLTTTAYHANWRQDRYLAHCDGVCRVPNCPGIGKTQGLIAGFAHTFDDAT
jgi:hypothetical protein